MNINIPQMLSFFIPVTLVTGYASAAEIPVEFEGISHKAIFEQPPTTTGLDAVYILYDTQGVSLSYQSSGTVNFFRFSNLGAAYAEEIQADKDGNVYRLNNLRGDCGYVIEDNGTNSYLWIVDYSAHPIELNSVTVDSESDCGSVALKVDGTCEAMRYYTINGRAMTLDREVTLSYSTLEYDSENSATTGYYQTTVTTTMEYLPETIYADAPLCNTEFTVAGDRFLKEWDLPEATCTSSYYQAIAVAAETTAVQTERDNDNEQTVETDGLGGSAPCEIEFRAYVTDAAIFKEWQMSRDEEFNDIFWRSNELEFTHVFDEEGMTYVRFTASNDDATCDYYGTTYDISIGSSAIVCPNAFSPGSSEGVNDIWKVSYKSIVDFECHIFNRWGIQVAHFSNPADGWDGKYKGKLVPAGVYYYVIKARGADGRNYNLKGDINIINMKTSIRGNATTVE